MVEPEKGDAPGDQSEGVDRSGCLEGGFTPENTAPDTFFKSLFGDSVGTLALAAIRPGGRVGERFLAYPDELAEAVTWAADQDAAGRDVYFAANLHRPGSRARGTAHIDRVLLVHADLDGTPAGDLAATPTVLVETSPGSLQGFWVLTESVDVEAGEALARGISAAHPEADNCGDAPHLMRVPGTRNHKPTRQLDDGSAPVVRVLEAVQGAWNPDELAKAYPPVQRATQVDAGALAVPEPVAWRDLSPRLRTGIENAQQAPDRSDHFAGLVRRCIDDGLTEAQAVYVMATHEGDGAKYGARLAAEVRRVWLKHGPAKVDDRPNSGLSAGAQRIVDSALDAADLDELADPVPLLGRLLNAEEFVTVLGKFGTYKSFVVAAWSYAVATGQPWSGHAVPSPVPVVYVAAEGRSGMRKRVRALERRYGMKVPPGMLTVIPRPTRLNNEDEIEGLRAVVEAKGAKLVILDTWHRMTPGLDENSSKDMGFAVDVALGLRDDFGATVVAAHHTGYSQKHGRGQSSIEDDGDASFLIKLGKGGADDEDRDPRVPRTLIHRKVKDGETLESMRLELTVDEHGDATVGTGPVGITIGGVAPADAAWIEEWSAKLDAYKVDRSAGKPRVEKAVRALGGKLGDARATALTKYRQSLDDPGLGPDCPPAPS